MPLDNDAAKLLREMFLDQRGHFLVFTSHVPVSIETNAVKAGDFLGKLANVPPNLRGVSTVDMSLGTTLIELRGMSTQCEGLTDEKAAWLAYTPSLIYSLMSFTGLHGIVSPSMRFMQMCIVIEPAKALDVLKRFAK
jgi:uncharacterized protein (AIM24 family)